MVIDEVRVKSFELLSFLNEFFWAKTYLHIFENNKIFIILTEAERPCQSWSGSEHMADKRKADHSLVILQWN